MIATSGFLTALDCTKFVFGRGSAPDPAGDLTALPHTPSWIKGALLLRGKGREGRGREKRGGSEGKGGDGKGGEGTQAATGCSI